MTSAIRILYVDDEPDLLNIGKMFLEQSGEFTVTTAISASEALRLLEQEKFDAIISDYQMPGMDGIQFLVEVRKRFGSIPFLLFTGRGREEVVIEAINSGVDFYIQKGGEPGAQFAELSHKVMSAASRKMSDVALKESEEKFHSLYTHMIEGAVLHELTYDDSGIPEDYVIIETNSAFEKQLGISRDTVIGKTSREAYGVAAPPFLEIYARVALTGKPESFETYFPPLAKHFSISAYCPKKGGFATIFEDITERKQAEGKLLKKNEELNASYEQIAATEEELRGNLDELARQEQAIRESEEKFRSLFAGSRDGIVMVDEQGRFLDANSVYCAMLGYSVEELRSISFPSVTPEKWHAWEGEEIWNHRLLKDGYTGIYEKEYVRKDGIVFPVELQAFTAFNPDRKVKYIWGIARDITDRKRAQEALAESEARYRTLVEHIPQKIFMKDRNSRYVSINENFANDLGIHPNGIVGKSDADLFPAKLAAKYRADDVRIMETGKTEEFEERYLNEGKETWVHTIKTVVKDKNGKISGVCGVFRDITDRKQAEEAVRASHDQLTKSEADLQIHQIELERQAEELRESKIALEESRDKYLDLYDFSPTGYFTLNEQALITDVNLAGATLLGVGRNKLVNKRFRIFIAENDSDKWLRYFLNVLKHEEKQTCTLTLKRGDNSTFPVRLESIRIIRSDGTPTVRVVVSDITDVRHVEEALRESEGQKTAILDGITTNIAFVDKDLKVIWANKFAAESVNKSPAEMAGHTCHALWADPARPCENCPTLKVFETKQSAHIIQHTPDGRIWNERGEPVFDANGNLIGVVEIAEDITERKRADEALAESEERFRGLVDTITSGVAIYEVRNDGTSGKDYIIKDFNKTALDLEGKKKNEVIGKSLFDLRPAIDEYGLIPVFQQVWKTGVPADFPQKVYLDEKYSNWYENRVFRLQSGEIVAVYDDITERKRAEEALAESEERFRNVIAATGEYVFEIDAHGVITFLSDRVKEILGYEPQELIGKTPFDIMISPEEVARVSAIFGEYIRNKLPIRRMEHNCLSKDGRELMLTVTALPILDAAGEIKCYQGTVEDITERKVAQEELLENRQRFQGLVETMYDWVWEVDCQGRYNYVSPRIKDILGYEPEELLGKTPFHIMPAEEMQRVSELFLQLTGEQTPIIAIENICLHKDGHPVIMETNGLPFYDTMGNFKGYRGTDRDITDRKRVEEALSESEQKLSIILNDITDVVWSLSWPDMNVHYISPSVEKLYGRALQEFIDKPSLWAEITHPDDKPISDNALEQLRKVGSAERECRIVRPDGSIVWIHDKSKIIFDENDTPIRVDGIASDITERKELEKEMESHALELRKFSTSLAAANKKLTLLSSITRHDINNQMTVLMGFLTILKKKQSDPTLNEYCSKASNAAQRISSMIQFTKEYESIGVKAPVWQDCRTVIDTAAKQAPLGQVIVKNDLPAGAEVFSDPLVVKVFYNLMDNAVRYGGKIRTIRFSVEEHDGDHVVVCEDDGDGVIAEEKEKIFARGFGKNTGMGLFLSSEILSITGITIRETGEPGKGARFEMTVPKGAWRMAGKGA